MKLPWRKLLVVAGVIQLLLAVSAISYFLYIRSDGRAEKTLGSVVNDAVPASSPSPIGLIPSVVNPARNRTVEFVLIAATQQPCATGRILGPQNRAYRVGDKVRLTARVTGAPPGVSFGYEWSVNFGAIISGQRTAQIVVDTTNAPNGFAASVKISSHVCINPIQSLKLRAIPTDSNENTSSQKQKLKTFTGRAVVADENSPAPGVDVLVFTIGGTGQREVVAHTTTDPRGRFRFATRLRGDFIFSFTSPHSDEVVSFQYITVRDGAYDLGTFRLRSGTISEPSPATPSPTAPSTPSPTQSGATPSPVVGPTSKPTVASTSAATTGEFVVTWPRALGPGEEGIVSISYTPPANNRLPRLGERFDKVEALVKPTNLRGLTLIDAREPTYRTLDNNESVWNYRVKAENDEVSEFFCDTEAQVRLTNTKTGEAVDLTSVKLGQANIDSLPVRRRTIFNSGMLLVPTGAGSLGLGIRKKKKAKCFFNASMNDQVKVASEVEVEVIVGREAISRNQISSIQSGAEAEADVDTEEKLTLQLEPVSNYKVVGPSRIDLDVPKLGSPKTLKFFVQATDVGEGEIEITVYQHQTMLVSLELKSRIVETLDQKPARSEAIATATESDPLREPLNQLLITEERHGDKVSFKYQLISPALDIVDDWVQPLVRESREYVDAIYSKIEGFRRESHTYADTKQQNDYFSRKLYSYGGELFDELFPEDLKRVLWSRRDRIDSIWVISTEPFIPWEMVCLKDPDVPGGATRGIFLAEIGLVRWLKKTSFPPTALRIRQGRALYVIPDYVDQNLRLPEAEEERVFLREKFNADATPADPLSILDILATPGRFDLLHFACHGKVALNKISDGCLVLQDRLEEGEYRPAPTLDPTDVGQGSNLRAPDNQPLVTVNACQAGRAGYLLSGMGGFAQSFIRNGAGAFVGTLWSIGDSPARTFTETFYDELLAGQTLCRATVTARQKAKSGDIATWLAYVVYGHPHMRLK